MNLAQAYNGWSRVKQNEDLYKNTRSAYSKAWANLDKGLPCSLYTEEMLGKSLASTRAVDSEKIRAASVMVQVLDWANFAEPKYNPKPPFSFEKLVAYTRMTKDELEAIPDKEEGIEDTDLEYKEAVVEPKEEIVEPKDEDMEKKVRGKQPKPVAQIDPETLKVMKVWPSRSEAERELGACNLDRAVSKKRKSVGYYWADPEDAKDFKPKEQPVKQAPKKPVGSRHLLSLPREISRCSRTTK